MALSIGVSRIADTPPPRQRQHHRDVEDKENRRLSSFGFKREPDSPDPKEETSAVGEARVIYIDDEPGPATPAPTPTRQLTYKDSPLVVLSDDEEADSAFAAELRSDADLTADLTDAEVAGFAKYPAVWAAYKEHGRGGWPY